MTQSVENDAPRRPVRVHARRLALRDDEPTREWYASCTDADWSQPGGRGCNWYGEYRDTEREAKTDAARHRRAHRVVPPEVH